jgi:Mg-chelatase subunit ChlD
LQAPATIVTNGQVYELAGYDDPGGFVPQASVGTGRGQSLSSSAKPLPRYRLKAAAPADETSRPTSGESVRDTEKTRRLASELALMGRSLGMSDVDASGLAPTPLVEAETLRNFERLRVEGEVGYIEQAKRLEQLKALSPEQLREVLPRTVPDTNLSDRISELDVADQQLARLSKDLPVNAPERLKAKARVEELNRKVDASVNGVMKAMEQQQAVHKSKLDALETTVNEARKLDLAKAERSRAYFDKKRELAELQKKLNDREPDAPVRKPSTNAPIPQPEIQTSENNFSTFSLNVSDVSFKLAAASLEKGQMPDVASVRSEEFINAFDYRDPEPPAGSPIAFTWERARYPFAHNRDLLRFSLKTAAAGRQAGRPLNIVLLLDNSGSMERADRVQIIRQALRVLAGQLQAQDRLSVITFARTARLVADGISGDKASEVAEAVSGLTPQGGTNLEDAMNLAYQTAAKHYLANGINRVVMLTDGAANLGDVEPDSLKQKVEAQRKQGIALDCFGIGWEGFNDDLLEVLSRNGDGRYGFINSPEEAATDFVGQLAGALKVAASDVKVQVEFNPKRTTAYRQIGYAKHQLTKEQFRDNTVDAAEIAAQEAGNALYSVEVNPRGEGPLCTVRVRYKVPGTTTYREQAWDVPYTGNALSLEQASPAMRLAASASAFAEWLVASPFAGEVAPDKLLNLIRGVPEVFGADSRPKKLEWMIRQAKSLEGK